MHHELFPVYPGYEHNVGLLNAAVVDFVGCEYL